jgi:2-dehydro-3-deoxyphosphooctonate aldolase (KDO 8-P synthase)
VFFFHKNKKFLLQIESVEDYFYPCLLSERLFQVFDIFQCFVSHRHCKHTQNTVLENKKQLETLAQQFEPLQKPFGVLVSSPQEVSLASSFAHFLYLPGELCRQTDLLHACAESGLPLFVEKGVFLAPTDLLGVLEKLSQAPQVFLVDCGTAVGYCDHILDPRSLFLMQHTCQKPFGIELSHLLAVPTPPWGKVSYTHRPSWLLNSNFAQAFFQVAQTLGASFYVTSASFASSSPTSDSNFRIEDLLTNLERIDPS